MDLSLLQMGNPWTGPPLIRSEYAVGRGYGVHTLTDHRSSCRLPLAIPQVSSRDLSDAGQHSDQPWENMESAGRFLCQIG